MSPLTVDDRAWIDAVVASAPALTTDQLTDLRRMLQPARPAIPAIAVMPPARRETTRRAA